MRIRIFRSNDSEANAKPNSKRIDFCECESIYQTDWNFDAIFRCGRIHTFIISVYTMSKMQRFSPILANLTLNLKV